MRKIENLKDLRSERARLKLELNVAEETLKEDIEWIKSELRPAHLAGKYLSNTLVNKDDGFLNVGLRRTIDTVLKSFVLSRAGWITKLVVPFIVKNISSNYVQEKKPEIFGMLKRWISTARKSTSSHHNHNGVHQQNGHYDKSTVDEMDY
jgi:hypothetical protein